MEIEIKFRGRDITGEWRYGFLGCSITGKYFIESIPEKIGNTNSKTQSHNIVDPKTIGLFTGLKYKNGVKSYSGDIIFSEHSKQNVAILFGEYKDTDEDTSTNIGFYFDEFGPIKCGFGKDINWSTEKYEIVGNIYDNPELLQQ